MEAVSQEQAPALKLLLSIGADVNILSSNGHSMLLALWTAAENGSRDIVNILLKASAVTDDLN